MRFFRVPATDAHIAYHDLPGAAPTRVFLSGAAGTPAPDYVEVAAQPSLAGTRRILLDLLGYGYSDRPEAWSYSYEDHAACVAALLDHAGVADCDVIAHSWSAGVVLALATLRRDLIRSAVLAEGSLGGLGGFTREVAARSEQEYVERGHAAMTAKLARDAGQSTSPFPRMVLAALRTAEPFAVHRGALALRDATDVRERFKALGIRRAYLVGAASQRPPGEKEELERAGIRYLRVPNVGHEMVSDPAAFAAAVAEALS